MRTVIFGVDGMTFRVLRPLIGRGELPNFARLQREGVTADFLSTVPPITPAAWMSIATGMKPAKHGVFDFWEYDMDSPNHEAKLVTHRKGGKAIWNILSEYGKRVIVMNVPLTYPPETVNGIMVSGLMTPGATSPFTFPHAFKEELFRVVPDYCIDLTTESVSTKSDYVVDEVMKMTEKRIQLQEHLLSEHEWDFAFLCYIEPDRIQHHIWDAIMEFKPEAVSFYRLVDEALGRVLNRLTPEDMLFVVSDHGFMGAERWFYINEYLYRRKLLLFGEPSERKRAKLIGYGREAVQKLHLLGPVRKARETYEHFFNKQPLIERKKGFYQPMFEYPTTDSTRAYVPSPSAFVAGCADIFFAPNATPAEIEELRQAFEAERDPETGKPLARAVHASDAFGVGACLPSEEHLVVIPSEGITFHVGGLGRRHLWETLRKPQGVHEPEGIFYAWGAGIRHGVQVDALQVYDLVPTMLHALGISVDEPFDGRVAQEIFEAAGAAEADESLVARKLKRLQMGKTSVSH